MKFIKTILVCILLLLLVSATSCKLFHKHSFGEWEKIQEPSALSNGMQQRTCECGNTETQAIPALGIEGIQNLLQGTWIDEDQQEQEIQLHIVFNGSECENAIVNKKTGEILLSFGSSTYTIDNTSISFSNGDRFTYILKDSIIINLIYEGDNTKYIKIR